MHGSDRRGPLDLEALHRPQPPRSAWFPPSHGGEQSCRPMIAGPLDADRAWGRGPVILKLESLERREPAGRHDASRPGQCLTDHAQPRRRLGRHRRGRRPDQEPRGCHHDPSFEVAIYASPVRGIDKYSVPIGEVTIPAGLAAGTVRPLSDHGPASRHADARRQQHRTERSISPPLSTRPRPSSRATTATTKTSGPPYDTVARHDRSAQAGQPGRHDAGGHTTDPTWGRQITVTAQVDQ